MKTNKLILTLSTFASVLLFSCKKEKDTPGISYQLKTSAPSASISSRIMGGNVQWTSGYASAAEIEFEAESKSVEIEYKSELKQKIDLFSPFSSLGMITVPAGTYKDIEYEVEVRPTATDAAFQLSGSFTNGNGVTTPLVFKVNTSLEIEAEQENVVITDGSNLTALTTLNLSFITVGVTESMLNNATRNNGIIEVSATSNDKIYQIMLHNLKGCGNVEVKN